MQKIILILLLIAIPFLTLADLTPGTKPAVVVLEGDNGGRVDGGKWSSEEIGGKVYTLMYVDPDEKELNKHVETALKAEEFPRENYGSIAIVNMAASWLPNFAIQSSLEKKQKEFPNTIYVKDLKKQIVKSWNLGDDTYNVVAFDKEGKVIFFKDGKLSSEELQKLIEAIRNAL